MWAQHEALERELARLESEIVLRDEVLEALEYARQTADLTRHRERALAQAIARVRASTAALEKCAPRALSASRGLAWIALAVLGAAAACRWLCPV